MRIILLSTAALICIVGLVAIIGWVLPVNHVATRSLRIKSPTAKVWATISDFKNAPTWRHELRSVAHVELSPEVFGWKEIAANGDAISYLTLEATPEQRLVRKIFDKNLPFGGSWTFEITAVADDTILSITENGEVYKPIFRFMSKFVFGHYATLDKYIRQLRKQLEA